MLELAIGIILGGCALGAGCAMIAGIGPGIGEGNAVAKACESGLAELNETHFSLTKQGKFLANEVMLEFLD